MIEQIKKEIESLYGNKQVKVIDIEKRLISGNIYGADKNLIKEKQYMFNIKVKIEGYEEFLICVAEISDIKSVFETELKANNIVWKN